MVDKEKVDWSNIDTSNSPEDKLGKSKILNLLSNGINSLSSNLKNGSIVKSIDSMVNTSKINVSDLASKTLRFLSMLKGGATDPTEMVNRLVKEYKPTGNVEVDTLNQYNQLNLAMLASISKNLQILIDDKKIDYSSLTEEEARIKRENVENAKLQVNSLLNRDSAKEVDIDSLSKMLNGIRGNGGNNGNTSNNNITLPPVLSNTGGMLKFIGKACAYTWIAYESGNIIKNIYDTMSNTKDGAKAGDDILNSLSLGLWHAAGGDEKVVQNISDVVYTPHNLLKENIYDPLKAWWVDKPNREDSRAFDMVGFRNLGNLDADTILSAYENVDNLYVNSNATSQVTSRMSVDALMDDFEERIENGGITPSGNIFLDIRSCKSRKDPNLWGCDQEFLLAQVVFLNYKNMGKNDIEAFDLTKIVPVDFQSVHYATTKDFLNAKYKGRSPIAKLLADKNEYIRQFKEAFYPDQVLFYVANLLRTQENLNSTYKVILNLIDRYFDDKLKNSTISYQDILQGSNMQERTKLLNSSLKFANIEKDTNNYQSYYPGLKEDKYVYTDFGPSKSSGSKGKLSLIQNLQNTTKASDKSAFSNGTVGNIFTETKIASKDFSKTPLLSIYKKDKRSFVSNLYHAMIHYLVSNGFSKVIENKPFLPFAIISQFALETGWGKRMLMSRKFEGFGTFHNEKIRAKGVAQEGDAIDVEYNDYGKSLLRTDLWKHKPYRAAWVLDAVEGSKHWYKVYEYLEDGFYSYFNWVNRHASEAFSSKDARSYIQTLKDHRYATDSKYVDSIMGIYNSKAMQDAMKSLLGEDYLNKLLEQREALHKEYDSEITIGKEAKDFVTSNETDDVKVFKEAKDFVPTNETNVSETSKEERDSVRVVSGVVVDNMLTTQYTGVNEPVKAKEVVDANRDVSQEKVKDLANGNSNNVEDDRFVINDSSDDCGLRICEVSNELIKDSQYSEPRRDQKGFYDSSSFVVDVLKKSGYSVDGTPDASMLEKILEGLGFNLKGTATAKNHKDVVKGDILLNVKDKRVMVYNGNDTVVEASPNGNGVHKWDKDDPNKDTKYSYWGPVPAKEVPKQNNGLNVEDPKATSSGDDANKNTSQVVWDSDTRNKAFEQNKGSQYKSNTKKVPISSRLDKPNEDLYPNNVGNSPSVNDAVEANKIVTSNNSVEDNAKKVVEQQDLLAKNSDSVQNPVSISPVNISPSTTNITNNNYIIMPNETSKLGIG